MICPDAFNPAQPPQPQADAPDPANIAKRVSILMEQRDWQNAYAYCQKALDFYPEDPELYLKLCMIGHQAANEDELARIPCNLNGDRNFQIALKYFSPERRLRMTAIQEQMLDAFINSLLQQCMAKYQIRSTDINDLVHCPVPLAEEQSFQMAVSIASQETRNKLQQIQANQPRSYLQQCLSRHPGSDLSTYPEPLMRQPDFQMALRCADPELRNQLLSYQAKQPEFFLQECMKSCGVSDRKALAKTKRRLADNKYFKYAMECGSPDFQKNMRDLMETQTHNIFYENPVLYVIFLCHHCNFPFPRMGPSARRRKRKKLQKRKARAMVKGLDSAANR